MLAFQEVEELESKVIILCYSKWESSLNYTYFSLPFQCCGLDTTSCANTPLLCVIPSPCFPSLFKPGWPSTLIILPCLLSPGITGLLLSK